MAPKLDWESEEIRVALEKARIAYERAPIGKKEHTLEKVFARYVGKRVSADTIRWHMRKAGSGVCNTLTNGNSGQKN